MAALTLALTAGSILAKALGKDIDFPFFNADIQIIDGVAVSAGNITVLDKGKKSDAIKVRDATIDQINASLKQLGVHGQKGLTPRSFQVGVVAGGRKGALSGGFFSGVSSGTKGHAFGAGIQNQGAQTVDEGITQAVQFAIQQIYDTSGAGFKQKVDAAGGAEGIARAGAVSSGLDIQVPQKFQASNFFTKLSKGLKIAAMVSGGFDLANAARSFSASAASGVSDAAAGVTAKGGRGLAIGLRGVSGSTLSGISSSTPQFLASAAANKGFAIPGLTAGGNLLGRVPSSVLSSVVDKTGLTSNVSPTVVDKTSQIPQPSRGSTLLSAGNLLPKADLAIRAASLIGGVVGLAAGTGALDSSSPKLPPLPPLDPIVKTPLPKLDPLDPIPTRGDPEIVKARKDQFNISRLRKGRRSSILTSGRGVVEKLGEVFRPRAAQLLGT